MLLTSTFGVGVGVLTLALYAWTLASAMPRPVFPPLRSVAQAAWAASGGKGAGDLPDVERRLAGTLAAPTGGWTASVRARAEELAARPTVEARWEAMLSVSPTLPDLRSTLGPGADRFPDEAAWSSRAQRAGIGVLRVSGASGALDLPADDVDEDALAGLPDAEREAALRIAQQILTATGAQGWVVCAVGLDGLRLARALAAVTPARDRVRAVVLLDAPLRGVSEPGDGPWSADAVADWLHAWFRHERLDVEWLRPVPWLTAARASQDVPDSASMARWAAARLPEPGFVGDGGWFRAQEPATLHVEDLGVFVAEDDDAALWRVLSAVGVLAALAAAG